MLLRESKVGWRFGSSWGTEENLNVTSNFHTKVETGDSWTWSGQTRTPVDPDWGWSLFQACFSGWAVINCSGGPVSKPAKSQSLLILKTTDCQEWMSRPRLVVFAFPDENLCQHNRFTVASRVYLHRTHRSHHRKALRLQLIPWVVDFNT